MSLLSGMGETLGNSMYDALMESTMENELDGEIAMEQTAEKFVELSEADYAAILDDNNPDNIAADMMAGDEKKEEVLDSEIDHTKDFL